MNLIDELFGLITEFEANDLQYAVCGGLALAAHGHPRFTKDIDVLVPKDQLPRISEAARRRGFTVEGGMLTFGAGTERERALYRISKVEGANVITLDLLLVGSAHDETWEDRVRVDWRGRHLWLVSKKGLMRMKQVAGRPQDLLDIEMLKQASKEEPHG